MVLDVFVFSGASLLALVFKFDLHVDMMLLEFICNYMSIYEGDLFD